MMHSLSSFLCAPVPCSAILRAWVAATDGACARARLSQQRCAAARPLLRPARLTYSPFACVTRTRRKRRFTVCRVAAPDPPALRAEELRSPPPHHAGNTSEWSQHSACALVSRGSLRTPWVGRSESLIGPSKTHACWYLQALLTKRAASGRAARRALPARSRPSGAQRCPAPAATTRRQLLTSAVDLAPGLLLLQLIGAPGARAGLAQDVTRSMMRSEITAEQAAVVFLDARRWVQPPHHDTAAATTTMAAQPYRCGGVVGHQSHALRAVLGVVPAAGRCHAAGRGCPCLAAVTQPFRRAATWMPAACCGKLQSWRQPPQTARSASRHARSGRDTPSGEPAPRTRGRPQCCPAAGGCRRLLPAPLPTPMRPPPPRGVPHASRAVLHELAAAGLSAAGCCRLREVGPAAPVLAALASGSSSSEETLSSEYGGSGSSPGVGGRRTLHAAPAARPCAHLRRAVASPSARMAAPCSLSARARRAARTSRSRRPLPTGTPPRLPPGARAVDGCSVHRIWQDPDH
jgi:hypothetical protein